MLATFLLALGLSVASAADNTENPHAEANSTLYNPIFPGFHPDPSCIYVPEWDDTYFCAASSFNAFPGLPIHASKDLRDWRLIGEFELPVSRTNLGLGLVSWRWNGGRGTPKCGLEVLLI